MLLEVLDTCLAIAHCKSPKILHCGANLSGSILGGCPTAVARVRSEFGRLVFVATSNVSIHRQIMALIGDLSGLLQDIPHGSSALALPP